MSDLVVYILILTSILVVLKLIVCELDGRRANKMYNLRYFLSFTQPFKYRNIKSLAFVAFICFFLLSDFKIFSIEGMLYCLLFLGLSICMDVLSQIAYYFYGKSRFKVGINKALKVQNDLNQALLVDDYDNIEYPDGTFDFEDICDQTFKEDYHVAICSMDGGKFASKLKKLPYVAFVIDHFNLKAKERFADSNVKVTTLTSNYGLPFKDEKLDEYIVNYSNFDKKDVYRVLKENGTLLIRHKGNDEMKELALQAFNPMRQTQWNLSICENILNQNGFYVYESKEVNDQIKFRSIESLLTYLKQTNIEETINIDTYLNQLAFINANIKQKGYFSLTKHEFYILATKR